jgi:hypothetical protein
MPHVGIHEHDEPCQLPARQLSASHFTQAGQSRCIGHDLLFTIRC